MGWLDQNPGARLILTGGNADASGRTEAAVMHDLLTDRGVAEDRLMLEDRAGSTKENFRNIAGMVSKDEPVVHCSFAFKNTGTAPLIIHQAFASCGCTVPTYTKEPIKPGEKGSIDVTYNGKDKFPGHFQKSITVRTNAVNEVVRLTIEGMME